MTAAPWWAAHRDQRAGDFEAAGFFGALEVFMMFSQLLRLYSRVSL
jgi:hypothetical protein